MKTWKIQHIQTIHDGIMHDCKQCDYKATNRKSLRNHTKTVHEGLKYVCEPCNLQFTQESSLKRHIKRCTM